MEITLLRDANGFLGRKCPQKNCSGYFKVRPGTGLTGANLPLHCAYCGYKGSADSFHTPEQIEYAQSVALREISSRFYRKLKQLEFNHPPAGGPIGIGISLKVTPGSPIAIRHYREKNVETHITCAKCTLEYAIYGLFAYCPDCGEHNSEQILNKNLDLIGKQLDLAATLSDADLTRHLIEDALENCVSAFDGFARESCAVRARLGTDPSIATQISFQNLDRANQRLQSQFGLDLSACLDAVEWKLTRRAFLRRHLLAHRGGVIDTQYVREALDTDAIPGRRLSITAAEVTALIGSVRRLGTALVGALQTP